MNLKLDHVLPDVDAALYEEDEPVTLYQEPDSISTRVSQRSTRATESSKPVFDNNLNPTSQIVSTPCLVLRWPWGKEFLSKNMIIGRDRSFSSMAPQLTDYKDISRIHAQIRLMNGKFYLYDLHSTNGTYVGEKRVPPDEPVCLQMGVQVRFAHELTATIEEFRAAEH